MNKLGFTHLKLTALVAVVALSLIGLSGLSNLTTRAQEQDSTENVSREVDLREKLRDKKFADGRRVEIHALSTGEKITAEVKKGKFAGLFLAAGDGTEVKGVVRSATTNTTNTDVCTATITTTTRERKGLHYVTKVTTTIVQFPCVLAGEGSSS